MKIFAALWRVLRAVLLGLAALVIFIEEWGWRPLTALAARIAHWPPLARLEARIAAVAPGIALALFLVPVLLLLPVKLGALWLIQEGRAALGVTLIVAAKIVGTAFVGRLFMLVETQLMHFAWLARWVRGWRGVKLKVFNAVRGSALWQGARNVRRTVRLWLHRWVH